MSSATLSEPLFISWYEAIHSPIGTKIRLFPSSNKREFVRYEIPTAKWLSNSKKRLSLLLHAVHEKKLASLVSVCSPFIRSTTADIGCSNHSFALLFFATR